MTFGERWARMTSGVPPFEGPDKRVNRKLARIRVRVEHSIAGAKRIRAVKDVLRNRKSGISDLTMEVACGLHNLRVTSRKRPTKR